MCRSFSGLRLLFGALGLIRELLAEGHVDVPGGGSGGAPRTRHGDPGAGSRTRPVSTTGARQFFSHRALVRTQCNWGGVLRVLDRIQLGVALLATLVERGVGDGREFVIG